MSGEETDPHEGVCALSFRQVRLDNTIQVLPASPLTQIGHGYAPPVRLFPLNSRHSSLCMRGEDADPHEGVCALSFRQVRLDNTIQVLPASPLTQIGHGYAPPVRLFPLNSRHSSLCMRGEDADPHEGVCALSFRQVRLDNTIQVLPASPLTQIGHGYASCASFNPSLTTKKQSSLCEHKDDFRRGSTLFYGYIRLLFALAPRRDPESVGGTFETPCNLPFSRGKALCLPHLSKTCPRPPRLRQGLS